MALDSNILIMAGLFVGGVISGYGGASFRGRNGSGKLLERVAVLETSLQYVQGELGHIRQSIGELYGLTRTLHGSKQGGPK